MIRDLSRVFQWYLPRSADDFTSPITKGIRHEERADARAAAGEDRAPLSDEELRDIYRALAGWPGSEAFPRLVRLLLLTGARRDEIRLLPWAEIVGDTWTVPAKRYKTGVAHTVPLTPQMIAALGQRPADTAAQPWVISAKGGRATFYGHGSGKAVLDKRIAAIRKAEGRAPMGRWTLHLLRKTVRTRLAALGVSKELAERVIGHKHESIVALYDKHDYLAERRAALELWNDALARIVGRT